MPLRALEEQLRGTIPPVLVFVGDEALLVSRAEELASAAVLDGAIASFNSTIVRAVDERASESISVARTLPMMAERRLVVVRGVEEASTELLENLLEYVKSPSESTVMLLCGLRWPKPSGGVDRGKRIEGAVKKLGGVHRFRSKDQDPVAFAVHTASEMGCALSNRDARALVEMVGGDLGRLKLEVQKLSNWLGGEGTINEEALRAVCSMLSEVEVWGLTDAIVERDVNRALATTHRLLEAGEAPHKMMAMISWQLRQLLQLQEVMRKGVDTRSAGIRMPARKLQRAKATLQRRPLSTWAVLEALSEANERMNSFRAGGRRVLEALVLKLVAQ